MNGTPRRHLIQSMIAHNSYHTCELISLRKYARAVVRLDVVVRSQPVIFGKNWPTQNVTGRHLYFRLYYSRMKPKETRCPCHDRPSRTCPFRPIRPHRPRTGCPPTPRRRHVESPDCRGIVPRPWHSKKPISTTFMANSMSPPAPKLSPSSIT